ncbi:DapH/DapD/GlmU-related protein (plasmid) [Haloferacaceae archaeon DSL9]
MTISTDVEQTQSVSETVRLTREEIAGYLGTPTTGPDTEITDLDSLGGATKTDLAFCIYDDPDYIRTSDAGIVICPLDMPEIPGRSLVHSPNPKLDFVKIAHEWFIDAVEETQIHPSAVIADGATVGERCQIGPNVFIGEDVTIGDGCVIRANTVIGGVGFGFSRDPSGKLLRQVHKGEVVIEDNVEIGANCSIDRAVFDKTIIGSGTKLSSSVHLAHQVEIGEDVTVAYQSGFAGGSTVGDRATIHPSVSVATDVSIGEDAEIGMNSAVLEDVPAGARVAGSPARALEKRQ